MRCCCIDGFCKASSTSRTLLRVRRNQDSNRISGIHRASVLFIEMLGDLQAPRRTLSRTPRITHVGTPDMSTQGQTPPALGSGRWFDLPIISMKIHDTTKLPKWAQDRIHELEARVERAEKTIPWTNPGMEWFTLFSPASRELPRSRFTLFTCSEHGTHPVCYIGAHDSVFVGRGRSNNPVRHEGAQPRSCL